MAAAPSTPPLFIRRAEFKCQKEVDQTDVLDSDLGSTATRLADAVLLLVPAALKCMVNASASNALSSVFRSFQLVTISLEEIRLVNADGPWLTINYSPCSYTEWTRKVSREEPLVTDIPTTHALSLTVKLDNSQDCLDVMEAVLAAKARLLRHLKWIDDRLPLLDRIYLSTVTMQLEGAPEVVLAHNPDWNTAVALPIAWSAFIDGTSSSVTPPRGSVSIYLQTHLGRSVVRLTAAVLEQCPLTPPHDGHLIAFTADPCPARQTEADGSDLGLQAKVVMRWVDLSTKSAAADGVGAVLQLPAAAPGGALVPAQLSAPPSLPELTLRHLIITLSLLVAVLALVVHHFLKQGKTSSGILLVDIAAGVSLAGMTLTALPIFAASSRAESPTPPAPADGQHALPEPPAHNTEGSGPPARSWALVLLQGDVVERDIGAEIESDGSAEEPTEGLSSSHAADAAADAGGNALGEDQVSQLPDDRFERSGATGQRRLIPSDSKRRTRSRMLQSSGQENSIDVDEVPASAPRNDTNYMPFMSDGPKRELLGLFREPGWQPPNVHPILVEDMVQRFFVGCKEDVAESRRRLLNTKAFREEHGINKVLETAQPRFFMFKRVYGHAILGRTKSGALCSLEKVGGVRKAFDEMMQQNVDKYELKKHIFFLSEYYDIMADPRPLPHGKVFKILDVKGLGMYDVFGSLFQFLYECTQLSSDHYPERLHSMYVVHAPSWITMLWKAFTPAIDPSTRERIQLCGSSKKKILQLLQQELDISLIPEEYGGQNTSDLYDSQYERDEWEFVRKLNAKFGAPTA